MSRVRYEAYRDSGVEWLGEVPARWDVKRLATLVHMKSGEGITADEIEEVGSFPVFGGNGIRGYSDRFTHDGDYPLVGRQGALCGNVNIARGRFWASEHAVVVTPNVTTSIEWLAHLLHTMNLNQYSVSAAQPGLAIDRIGALRIPVPPHDEQRAIAAFLDPETARIDALVEKKRLLIERLDEQRTALISRTVTRGLPPEVARAAGLDPSPRLKSSGVEWLGEVPEHWEVVRNRWLFDERDERSDDGEGELLTVSHITGVTRRSEKPDVGMFMAETLEGYKRCYAGDLVINTMWAWMGAAGIASESGLVSPSYNVYGPNERLLSGFTDLLFRSRRYVVGVTSESRGIWTSRLRLYPDQFMSLVTAVPPLEEQEAIIRHVEQIELQSQAKKAAVETAIERLQEYRTALISAAITGKIDVRHAAPVLASDG